MSTTEVSTTEVTDPELITRVRDGDIDAYGMLFSRHVDAATRLARMLVGGPDADDLVSDAFVKVLNVLLGGGGPDVAFRAYLLTAVRRLHVDKIRSSQKLTTAGDMTPFDPGVPFTDTAVAGFEGGAAAKAFASLPERWQMVLWHLEVENQKPADIAPLLGMSPNSVSALAYRAREGLRQAFLTMHAGDLAGPDCETTRSQLGGYVRGGLSRRETAKVEDHLEHCRPCTAVYLELVDVNSSIAGWLAPALLGAAAAGYAGTGAAAGGAGLGVAALVGRARDFVVANGQVAAASAVAVGVAGIATLVVVTGGSDDRPAASDRGGDSPSSEVAGPDEIADLVLRDRPRTREPRPLSPSARPTTPAGTPSERLAAAGTTPEATSDTPSEGDQGPGPEDAAAPPAPGGQPADTGDGPAPGPDPAPKPEPKPEPKPKPDPKPTTPPPSSEPPPSGPPPSEPPPPQQPDVRLSASVGLPTGNRATITVVVVGIPAGSDGTLQISSTRGNVRRVAGPPCSNRGRGITCRVGPGAATFVFDHNDRRETSVTIELSGPGFDERRQLRLG